MTDKVEVRFTIRVEGVIGGSFEMDRKDYDRLHEKWESRPSRRDETDLAEELLDLAPFNYFNHLNVDDMEIEELQLKESGDD